MGRLVVVAVCAGGLAVFSAGLARADRVQVPFRDAATENSVWTGWFSRFGTPRGNLRGLIATDARLTVTDRSGEVIEAELWIAEGSKGLALRGKVGRDGSLRLRVVKALRGEWPDDLTGRVAVTGVLRRRWIDLQYEIPAERPSRGEVRLHFAPWLSAEK